MLLRTLPILLVMLLTVGCAKPALPSTAPKEDEGNPPTSHTQLPPNISQPQDPFEVLPEEDEAPDMQESPETSLDKSEKPVSNSPKSESRDFWQIREDMVENVKANKEKNPDTVGWLYLYDTTIDSPVFQTTDNDFYLKHNDDKELDRNGAIVSDCNNILSGRAGQSRNVVLYAHSKDENPDGGVESSREYEHFTELKRYQDMEFCKSHPYFLFTTAEESMVFEVFAAFHTKTSFCYNQPNVDEAAQAEILREAMQKSLFHFGVEVQPGDKIMTLSTCCRRIVPTYPNGYRFVIMGRLVESGKQLNYDRTVTENPTALTLDNIYE